MVSAPTNAEAAPASPGELPEQFGRYRDKELVYEVARDQGVVEGRPTFDHERFDTSFGPQGLQGSSEIDGTRWVSGRPHHLGVLAQPFDHPLRDRIREQDQDFLPSLDDQMLFQREVTCVGDDNREWRHPIQRIQAEREPLGPQRASADHNGVGL